MADIPAPEPTNSSQKGTAWEVFWTFLKLGLTSFGGPIAHLGYFRTETVQRRGWLKDEEYADLVALCQFLPGPASSQVGFALGMHRAWLPGRARCICGLHASLRSTLSLIRFGHFAFRFPIHPRPSHRPQGCCSRHCRSSSTWHGKEPHTGQNPRNHCGYRRRLRTASTGIRRASNCDYLWPCRRLFLLPLFNNNYRRKSSPSYPPHCWNRLAGVIRDTPSRTPTTTGRHGLFSCRAC